MVWEKGGISAQLEDYLKKLMKAQGSIQLMGVDPLQVTRNYYNFE
jgi:hypothetical protein